MKANSIFGELNITRSFYSVVVKRFFDISLSLFAIIVLSLFFLITAILTLIFIGRPVIYKQARPGKDHKVFHIYKFRSMTNKKDKNGKLLPDELRITKWGKFLRKTSLDELPQLFNILKGDMSFVGPRPRLVKDMVFYDKDVYKFYIVRPGLTGPTQSDGRNKNSWEQVFEKDIAYLHKITFWGDLKIFIKTFTSIFKNTGETHSNAEEDKTEVKEQEYYYADYVRRIGKISDEQYHRGLEISTEIIKSNSVIEFYPELHNDPVEETIKTKNSTQSEINTSESVNNSVKNVSESITDSLIESDVGEDVNSSVEDVEIKTIKTA